MPVFDFNNTPDTKEPVKCTYTTFASDAGSCISGAADSDSG